ncbi:MAG: hypothetical protein PS018_21830 [bacterium]|nr:hypothetical protein [bacterium]
MAEDERTFIERVGSVEEKHNEKPISVDDITTNFALYGLEKRAGALERVDAELRDEIDSGAHSLRRRAQLMALRKKLGGVHEALRKARR